MSRLAARNTANDYDSLRPYVEQVMGEIYNSADVALEPFGSDKEPLGVRVVAAGSHELSALLARL